jgi:hypothetical protein
VEIAQRFWQFTGMAMQAYAEQFFLRHMASLSCFLYVVYREKTRFGIMHFMQVYA